MAYARRCPIRSSDKSLPGRWPPRPSRGHNCCARIHTSSRSSRSMQPWRHPTYHAAIASLQRRFSKGLTLNGSYTFSKLMDLALGNFAGETLSTGGFQNFNNLRADRSLSALDAPHRLVINGLYSLPFGAGRRFNPGGLPGVVVNGWEVAAIYSVQSGGPLAIFERDEYELSQGGGQRPNLIGDPTLPDGERTLARWFNTSAFAAPPAYTFGTAPRSLGNIRSDALSSIDFPS